MPSIHSASRAAMILAGISLIAVIANGVLLLGNQRGEAEVQARQQYIAQTQQVGQVSAALVQALANASVNGKDAAISDLLAAQGITVSPPGSAPQTGTASAPSSAGSSSAVPATTP